MLRITSIIAACAVSRIFVAACASSPSHFYTLSKVAAPSTTSSNLSVAVGPVSIPAIVDLPQFVVSMGPNQVTLNEYERWASPLQNNISRVVAENLVAMLGTPRVSLFSSRSTRSADHHVAIEVQFRVGAGRCRDPECGVDRRAVRKTRSRRSDAPPFASRQCSRDTTRSPPPTAARLGA